MAPSTPSNDGLPRYAAARALAGAGVIGMLVAHATSDAEVEILNRLVPRSLPPPGLVQGAAPNDVIRIYGAGFATVFLCVGLVAVTLSLIASRSPRALRLAAVLTPAVALVASLTYHRNAILIALASLAVLIPLLVGASSARLTPRRGPVVLAYVLGGEWAAFLWGVWLCTSALGSARALGAGMAGLLAVVLRAHAVATSRSPRRSALLEARAFAPMALTPLLGLLRDPPLAWVGALLVVCVVLRVVRRARRVASALSFGALVVLVTWSGAAMLDIPLRLRDLPNINYDGHEAGPYGWVNAALHGRMLMADASTIYGPLREYCLTFFLLLAGENALQVRIAQVVMNLLGIAAIVPVFWQITRRSVMLTALGAYLCLAWTHIFAFLDYANNVSFGWADFARTAFPAAIAYSGVTAIADSRGSRRDRLRVVSMGVLSGLCIFYVQELGPVSCASVVLGALASAALRPGVPSMGRRLLEGARSCVPYVAGAALGVAVFLIPYVITGKVTALFRTLFFTALAFNAGFGTFLFPIAHEDFFSWASLTADAPHGALRLEYIVPPMVYLAQGLCLVAPALTRRWTSRDSALLSVLAFGVVSFRVAMGRSDPGHLLCATTPAILLLTNLVNNACDAVDELLGAFVPRLYTLGALVATVLVVSSLSTGFKIGVVPKVVGILAGDEKPSSGPPYVYPDIPRAGDMRLADATLEIVRLVLAHSGPGDALFYRGHATFGAEFYFLTNRRNPTRFDLPDEMLTHSLEDEALADLKRDPPKVVITDDTHVESPEAPAFFAEHYQSIAHIHGNSVDVWRGP